MVEEFNKNSEHALEETDLIGFDGLWDADYKETKDFLKSRKIQNIGSNNIELELLYKEFEEKDFEIQKLQWQLSEREKELNKLYDELHKLLELNKKLNKQLSDFENLSDKQDSLLRLLGAGQKNTEPVLPKFG